MNKFEDELHSSDIVLDTSGFKFGMKGAYTILYPYALCSSSIGVFTGLRSHELLEKKRRLHRAWHDIGNYKIKKTYATSSNADPNDTLNG